MAKKENQNFDDMDNISGENKTDDAVDETLSDKKETTNEESCEEKENLSEEEKNAGNNQSNEDENTKYLRLYADFQNFKKRTEKEKSDIYAYANEKISLDMLDVIDNFELALSHKEGVSETFVEGMEKILKQFRGVLEKNGIEEIESLGKEFDPMFHHAVMTEDTSEFESGMVSDVLKKGYVLNGKVIRATMVKVAN